MLLIKLEQEHEGDVEDCRVNGARASGATPARTTSSRTRTTTRLLSRVTKNIRGSPQARTPGMQTGGEMGGGLWTRGVAARCIGQYVSPCTTQLVTLTAFYYQLIKLGVTSISKFLDTTQLVR